MMQQERGERRRIRLTDGAGEGGSPFPPRLFELGRLTMTASAAATLHQPDVAAAILRHRVGDWGSLDHDDWTANQNALAQGLRLLSVYFDRRGTKFYIITEADRSVTSVLLPDEY
jgi:hypothetical protein